MNTLCIRCYRLEHFRSAVSLKLYKNCEWGSINPTFQDKEDNSLVSLHKGPIDTEQIHRQVTILTLTCVTWQLMIHKLPPFRGPQNILYLFNKCIQLLYMRLKDRGQNFLFLSTNHSTRYIIGTHISTSIQLQTKANLWQRHLIHYATKNPTLNNMLKNKVLSLTKCRLPQKRLILTSSWREVFGFSINSVVVVLTK